MTTQGTDGCVLRIAQITDTHLYADPESCLLGLNTAQCLRQVVALASKREPQLVVASGDLSHDATPQAYRQLRERLAAIAAPAYCLPGNHDEPDLLRQHLNEGHCHTTSGLHTHGWHLLFLDSTVAGSEGGHFSERELDTLSQSLERLPDTPTLIWLHHQPVAVGSPWLDTMAVDNPDDFFSVTDRHRQIRGILWGHVHQRFERERNGTRLLAAPSTCIQFLPGSQDFALEAVPPGYRWLDLYDDGHFETGIERLPAIPGAIDPAARGY